MVSKHQSKKKEAMALRRSGRSIPEIERVLNIPRSTLSGWFQGIELTKKQKERLHQEWLNALVKAREKSALRHAELKQMRILKAFTEAQKVMENVNLEDDSILEIILAMLYWGEGAKTGNRIFIGNSNPHLLKFFLDGLTRVYKLPRNSVGCALHLRADQDPVEMKKFWSKALQIPIECIREVYFDSRTKGSKTWADYHGVCAIFYFNSHLWRRLLSFSQLVSQVDFQNKGT